MTSCGSKSEDSSSQTKDDNVEEIESSLSSETSYSDVDDIASPTSDDSSSSDVDDSSSSDVDDMLNEYEKFVDNYISMVKKVAKGDMSVMAKMNDYMESAESLSRKIDNCSGSMNSSQMQRYMKITGKMTEAAADIAGGVANSGEMMENAMNNAADMLKGMDFNF
ncbi:MAG: hypothetical protein K2J66_05185 [Muribaculaceae bacterium]|nr:hypothetical protein [Muribaculaceae bacterium]